MAATGKKGAKLLVVGLNPDECDDQATSQPFTGPVGRLVKQEILKPLGLGPTDCAFTNAVRCLPPYEREYKIGKPTAAQVSLCSAFLIQDLNRIKPKGVVCLGR